MQICDMVAIARSLNVTLIVPELDKTSFWNDPRSILVTNTDKYRNSECYTMLHVMNFYLILHTLNIIFHGCSEFQDIFDVDHFITLLRDEVRILKDLPPRVKSRVELGIIHTMPPISWSDISYYHNQVIRLIYSFPYIFHEICKFGCMLTDICSLFLACRFFLSFRNTKLFI